MMVSFFLGVRDTHGITEHMDRRGLISVLAESSQEVRERSEKLDAIMLSVTTYRPGTTRAKSNAICAEVMAMDVDDGWSMDEAEATLREMGLAYVLHSTTKCSAQNHRFRIIVFLDRPVSALEYETLWLAVADRFGVGMDRSTRDISRLSVMPATWSGALNVFRAQEDGGLLDVDDVLLSYVPAPTADLDWGSLASTWESTPCKRGLFDPLCEHRSELRRKRHGDLPTQNLTDLDSSPIVPQAALERASTSPRGGRTYKLLCAVAASARRKGYELDQHSLAEIARQFSFRVGRRTSSWELHRDASRAMAWSQSLMD